MATPIPATPTGSLIVPLEELVQRISNGDCLAVPTDFNGFYAATAMAATRALIRRNVKGLHLVSLPTAGLQADLLIGAGCVATNEASAVFIGEYGVPPRFLAAFRSKSIRVLEATCPALAVAFQAGERGVPFGILRGVLGSDVIRLRPDWKVIENPFERDDPILAIPAINPDWTLFHAPMADRFGNVYYGRRRELATMARAAEGTLVTVERLYEHDLMQDEVLSCSTLPSVYVSAVSVVPRGAAPYGHGDEYEEDSAHIRAYMKSATTEDGFAEYLRMHVLNEQVPGV